MPSVQPKVFAVGVVESDDSVRKALARLFRAEGWSVCTFSGDETPESAQAACREQSLACLVVDLGWPKLQLESFRTCAALCPIVAISAQEDDVTRERAHRIGASAFFRKPVDDQALLDAIRWAVSART